VKSAAPAANVGAVPERTETRIRVDSKTSSMTEHIATTAAKAVQAGGEYLRGRFQSGETDADYHEHDVKARADRESEARMLDMIRENHPEHRIYAEESGEHDGESDYRWIVDPLDGTNNFAVGLSTFAAAAAVLDGHRPEAAAVYAPIPDDLYVARVGEGVRHDGDPVSVTDGDAVPLEQATVGVVIGRGVKGDDDRAATAAAIGEALDDACKRFLWAWAPTVYWGLLARGRIDAMVTLHPDDEEQVAGDLLAQEAGCVHRQEGPLSAYVANPANLDPLWSALDQVIR
jgi:myo-inositol-1(or 4)-monophosphatase